MTKNRRARISPYVTIGSIDPHLGLIRVDDMNGKPIATVWNFAVHGVCYDESNMKFSSDIMGTLFLYKYIFLYFTFSFFVYFTYLLSLSFIISHHS